MTPTRAFLCLLALALVPPAARGEPPDLFTELASGYRPEDLPRLPALATRLADEIPDLFERALPPCPLRSALARSLTADEARAWLSRPDDADALAVVVDNLAARPDLATLVLETGAYERLEPDHARLLSQVAANALLDGEDGLLQRLLAGPGWEHAADLLSRLPHPEGLQALADAVLHAGWLAPQARARLALYEPDVQNERPVRPLGAARVEALVGVAADDPDPAVRALAARILLRANDPAHGAETARAFVAARSVHLGSIDWHHLAKLAPIPVTDPRVSIEYRLDMLEGWLLWTWFRAEQEPREAEAHAAALRPVLAAAGPRFRGEAIVVLADHVGVFVTTTHGRKRPVPSFLAILEDLEAARPADPPALTALAREAAARIRAQLREEEGYPKVRVRECPLAAESAWRPYRRTLDTALADLEDDIVSLERFDVGLARVEDVNLPPDARWRLFERLLSLALDGGPAGADAEVAEEAEDAEEEPFDRRAFDRLTAWLVERAPFLDGGLPEALLGSLLGSYVPEELEGRLAESVARAIDRVPPGGQRMRLVDLRERSLEGR